MRPVRDRPVSTSVSRPLPTALAILQPTYARTAGAAPLGPIGTGTHRAIKSESIGRKRAGGGVSGGGRPGRCFPLPADGGGTMPAALAIPANTAATFLTHFFGNGLVDDTYVVERFRARADGDIRPWSGESPAPANRKGRRKAKRATASLTTVKELRPARTEIIICTGLKTRGGVQIWGDIASGLFHDRRQRG